MKQNHSQQELRHHRLNTVDPIRFGCILLIATSGPGSGAPLRRN